ncbi:Ppx/GppA phosphatase family protein [Clostridium sp. YIM B02551]|uniref:Ppx/GppA phosphatase family protein n=1 Tax=Clostridium sp. YIM B02551 TaxID=2910679 RepID=UPI001EECADD5|nr:Ppx/GppA phosphatase family protein [Clostridium sp. YIM B02551]
MKRIGVIDIGSNSVRVMLAEIEDSGYFRIIDELKEPVRISQDLLEADEISEDTFNILLSTLRSFKSLCTGSGASKIFTVATDALRTCKNGKSIITKISEMLDINIEILSNEDEIYYNYLSVKNTTYTENSLLVEVSGVNTYFAWIKNGNMIKSTTIPLGSLNLSYNFNLNDRIIHEDYENALEEVTNTLSSIEWLKTENFDNIIGIGTAFRTLGKIDQRRKRYPLFLTHNYTFNDFDLSEIHNGLKSKDFKQRLRVEGISPDVGDIIVGATLIIKVLCKNLNIADLEICGRGIREGIIFDYITKNFAPIDDILDYSIQGIMETLHVNIKHAKHVHDITKRLFEQMEPLHHLNSSYNKIVKTASLLHDCGISIKYYNHHKHSFYVILNSYMNGLTHKELLMSALTAAYHRNNSYTIPLPQFCSILNKLDATSVEKIGILLRISEGLDRSLEGAVKDVNVDIADEEIKLTVFSSIPLELEIRQALRSKDKFYEIYHKTLTIENIIK